MIKFDSHDILNRKNNTERTVIDRRFNEIDRQIGELTDLVLALTQQMSSNPRERKELNTVTTNANSRSDMVTESRTHNYRAHEQLHQTGHPDVMTLASHN